NCYHHDRVRYRQVNSLPSCLDSVSVVCDTSHDNPTTHDHPNALVISTSQVYKASLEPHKHQNRTSLNRLAFVSSLVLKGKMVQLYHKTMGVPAAVCLEQDMMNLMVQRRRS